MQMCKKRQSSFIDSVRSWGDQQNRVDYSLYQLPTPLEQMCAAYILRCRLGDRLGAGYRHSVERTNMSEYLGCDKIKKTCRL